MVETNNPRVIFDIGELGGIFDLALEEVLPWLEKEAAFWAWTSQVPDQPIAGIVNQVRTQLKQLRRNIDPMLQKTLGSMSPEATEALSRTIETHWKALKVPHSSSIKGKFIADLASKDSTEAIAAAAYFLGIHSQTFVSPKHIKGATRAILFELGLSAAPDAATLALTGLLTEWSDQLTEAKRQSRETLEFINADQKRTSETLAALSDKATNQLTLEEEELKVFKGQWTKDFENLRATYDADLALKAPVTYWSGKRQYHGNKGSKFARALCWYFVAGFCTLAFASSQLLQGDIAGFSKLPLWYLVAFTTTALLFLWGARLLVRLMLSQQHLEADAHERVPLGPNLLLLLLLLAPLIITLTLITMVLLFLLVAMLNLPVLIALRVPIR